MLVNRRWTEFSRFVNNCSIHIKVLSMGCLLILIAKHLLLKVPVCLCILIVHKCIMSIITCHCVSNSASCWFLPLLNKWTLIKSIIFRFLERLFQFIFICFSFNFARNFLRRVFGTRIWYLSSQNKVCMLFDGKVLMDFELLLLNIRLRSRLAFWKK